MPMQPGFRRVRRSRDEIATILHDFDSTRLTQREFSDFAGVPLSTLLSWRRRVGSGAGTVVRASSSPAAGFVPVRVVDRHERTHPAASTPVPAIQSFWVRLRSGHEVHVSASFEVESLRRLVVALETAC